MCKWNSKARRLTGTNFEDLKKSDVSQMLKDLMRHLRSFSDLPHSHETLFNNCFTNSVRSSTVQVCMQPQIFSLRNDQNQNVLTILSSKSLGPRRTSQNLTTPEACLDRARIATHT